MQSRVLLWVLAGAVLTTATLSTIALAWLAALHWVPEPLFAGVSQLTCVMWIGVIALNCVLCVRGRVDMWGRRLLQSIEDHEPQGSRSQRLDEADRLRLVKE